MTSLRFAVVSDVHAGARDAEWTHVFPEPPRARALTQPLRDLLDHAARAPDELQNVDYLIVPGDIADQADASGLEYAWELLNELGSVLGAELIAVPGNHDVVTRSFTPNPRGYLQSLSPPFPTRDLESNRYFWQHGWVLIERPLVRFLIIDSTASFPPYPAGAAEDSAEFTEYYHALDRGAFPEETEDAIRSQLQALPHKLNVAVVHHHPQEHQARQEMQDGYGPMLRGEALLDLLAEHPTTGRWLVIHGHKHIPQLVHATTTTSNGPVVLCAASLGAKLWSPIDTVTRNQFHIVTTLADEQSAVSSLLGRVDSYMWGYGAGWSRSYRAGAGLPGEAGFGSGLDFRALASQIVHIMDSDQLNFIDCANLSERVTSFPYLLPRDAEFLVRELDARGFAFLHDDSMRPRQLYRKERLA